MQQVDFYIDAAKARQHFKSDRELSRALGAKGNPVTQWRCRRSWPADDTMLRLADLAGLDPVNSLMDLNRWRAASSNVRSVYERIAHRLSGTAASIIVALGVAGYGIVGSGDASAKVSSAQGNQCILWKI